MCSASASPVRVLVLTGNVRAGGPEEEDVSHLFSQKELMQVLPGQPLTDLTAHRTHK